MTRLQIFRAQSVQWSGIIFENGEETCRIAGCASPDSVVQAAADNMIDLDEIELEQTDDTDD